MTHSHANLRVSRGITTQEQLSVITPVANRDGQRSAMLLVDQDHPFFFDHPLDHVSGILLVTGLLDLVRSSADPYLGGRGGRRIRFSVKFIKMCELDRRVVLFAEPGPAKEGTGWAIRAVQDDKIVCFGSVELVTEVEPPPRWPQYIGPVTPIQAPVVHRADPRNVVIGEPAISPGFFDVPLISPEPGHFLLRNGEQRYGVEEIVESGRQLFTALCHLAHDRPDDTRLLWLGVTADLPTGSSRSVPLALRWPVCPPRDDREYFDYTVLARGGSRPLGSLSYVVKCLTPAAYRELREKARRA